MPLYEYQCSRCGKVHEVMQKFSDEPITECPDEACKGPVAKLMSMGSFALKGAGWYTTDYKRKPSSGNAGGSEGGGASGGGTPPVSK